MTYHYQQLGPADLPLLRALNALFADAFEERDTYLGAPPSDAYLRALLAKPHFHAIVALHDGELAGGLAAYELEKFERERREIYVYDLAVAAAHRRRRVATGLLEELKRVARERQAWVVFVQADHGDDPAIRLYESLGTREEVLHFDLDPAAPRRP